MEVIMQQNIESRSYKLRHSFYLILATVFWGTTFVAQSIAMEYMEPFTYNACRFFVGAVVLLPLAVFTGRRDPLAVNYSDEDGKVSDRGDEGSKAKKTLHLPKNKGQMGDGSDSSLKGTAIPAYGISERRRNLLIGGILVGICLFVAGGLQQAGMVYTTAGKAGFITALYIVLVPVLGLLIFRKKCSLIVIPAIGIAIVGFYFLCMKQGAPVNKGDLITLASSVVFAMHILTVDHFIPKVNGVQLSFIQFIVAGCLSLIPAFLLETPSWSGIAACVGPILYAGILSSGGGYTLQIIGQRGLNPTAASMLMSLESVVAAISGWLILGDVLSRRELFGCVLVFAGVILAQLPAPRGKNQGNTD